MNGIVGINLTPERVQQVLEDYLASYYANLERAVDEAGGRLQISVSGGDPWAPEFPDELRPGWTSEIRATHDGETFYVDIDGPVQHGVFVTQAIAIELYWDREYPGAREAFHITKVEVEPMRIRVFDDQSLDLGAARAVTTGLIAAGRLMATLIETSQEVR